MTDGSEVVQLQEALTEKDLGVLMDPSLSFKQHITAIATEASQKVGMIWRTFNHMDEEMFLLLYKPLVRQKLEVAHVVWKPRWKCDLLTLEGVQRKATRMVKDLRDLSYAERLEKLCLQSVEYRLNRGDMIECWKLLNGKYDSAFPWLIPDYDSNLRSNGRKLKKLRFESATKRKVFSTRVVEVWNKLPPSVVLAPSIDSFKSRLDHHWKDQWYTHSME